MRTRYARRYDPVVKFARSIPIRPIGTARRGIKVDLRFNRRLVLRPPPWPKWRYVRTSTSEPIFKGKYDRVRCSRVLLGIATSGSKPRARFCLLSLPANCSSRVRFLANLPALPFAYTRSSYSTLGALSIPITLKLSINSTVEHFTRGIAGTAVGHFSGADVGGRGISGAEI